MEKFLKHESDFFRDTCNEHLKNRHDYVLTSDFAQDLTFPTLVKIVCH